MALSFISPKDFKEADLCWNWLRPSESSAYPVFSLSELLSSSLIAVANFSTPALFSRLPAFNFSEPFFNFSLAWFRFARASCNFAKLLDENPSSIWPMPVAKDLDARDISSWDLDNFSFISA